MRDYISLHNHTIFSIGDALTSVDSLFSKAKEFGQKAIAVTDHGTTAGLWDALKVSKKHNVKLISGCECYFVDDNSIQDDNINFRHIILLAKNAKGYKNLLTLNKVAYDNFKVAFKKAIPMVDWKILETYSDGLICTTACGNGIPGQFIMKDEPEKAFEACKRLKDIFGDNLALELQPHNLQRRTTVYSGAINQQKINISLKKISEELNIKAIVSTDSHYLLKEHHRAHDVILCDSSGQPISSGARLKYDKQEFYVKSADDVYKHFERHLPMWGESFVNSLFENTIYFSDMCENPEWIDPAFVTGEKNQLPDFPIKNEHDYEEFLNWRDDKESPIFKDGIKEDALFYRYRSERGLADKVATGKIPKTDIPECIDATKEEFDVLEYRNFSSYMLIVADYVNWSKKNDIMVGSGRGSCGGSYTAYFNGIHEAYPKKYNLLFARFINKYKDSYPDIDLDFAPSGRDKVHNYLREKYGYDNVANVSNVNTLTPKVYARMISRVFDFGGEGRSKAAEIGNLIADSIPDSMNSINQALKEAPLFAEYAKQYPELAEFSELLCGKPKAWSTHAGGIIISKRPLVGLVPVRKDLSGILVLEYDKERAESNGLVKMDTLGLSTLDIIGTTNKLIHQSGKELKYFDYEIEDEKTYNLISEGDTFGVFQLASTAVHVCKKIKPKDIKDIAIISALVRPSSKEIINDFIKVRDGEEDMNLIHPSLKRAFAHTNGFGLFEESLLFAALDVAGWDLHDADKLRKMTKEKGKSPEKVQKWKEEFISGAVKNNGIDEEIATKIWDDNISSFQGYGFNCSHATLYSMISFQTAWLKAHYPIEFLVANLMAEVNSNAKAAKDNINKIKNEIRAKGIKIVSPNVNYSETAYKIIDEKTIMASLDSLKYMSDKAMPEIIAKRPFSSFQDLVYRTNSSLVKSQTIQALAASGGLDDFGLDRKIIFCYVSDYRAKLKSHMAKLDRETIKSWLKSNKSITKIKDGKEDRYYLDNVLISPPHPTEEEKQIHLANFAYPFPGNEKPWTIQEKFALEEFYMGEGISGDMFDRYAGFFKKNKTVPFSILPKLLPYIGKSDDEKEDRKLNTHYLGDIQKLDPLEAVITNVFSFVVKKETSKIFGQEMARIQVQDPYGTELTLLCFPEAWETFKERINKLSSGKQKIEPGIAIRFICSFQWENENTNSLILNVILAYKAPPSIPEKAERTSKKVKMPRGSGARVVIEPEELETMDEEELAEVLEEEIIDEGMSPIDDEDDEDLVDPFDF